MRRAIAFLSALTLLPALALAQPTAATSTDALALAEVQKLEDSGRTRVNTGTFLVILGVGGLIGGSVLIAEGQSDNDGSLDEEVDSVFETTGGIVLVGLGGLFAAGGLAAIVSGKQRISSARQQRRQLQISPTRGGVAFGLSGTF